MKCTVITLFPEMVEAIASTSILGRAVKNNFIEFQAVQLRDYADNDRGKVDDYTYGGGAGLMIQAEPVYRAHSAVTGGRKVRTIFLTPSGTPFTQQLAADMAEEEELVFLCGHYEGIDERVLEEVVTDRVSIGDYVLTGGELPAMIMIDAISRLVPGVLGNETSAEIESFHRNLLEYPQFTRPEVWHEKGIPEVLLSGDHRKIEDWRIRESEKRTREYRPDLYQKYREAQEVYRILFKHKKRYMPALEAIRLHDTRILANTEEYIVIWDLNEKALFLCGLQSGSDWQEIPLEIPAEVQTVYQTGCCRTSLSEDEWETGQKQLLVFTEKSPLSGATYEKDPLKKRCMDFTNGKIMQYEVPWKSLDPNETEEIAMFRRLRYYDSDSALFVSNRKG